MTWSRALESEPLGFRIVVLWMDDVLSYAGESDRGWKWIWWTTKNMLEKCLTFSMLGDFGTLYVCKTQCRVAAREAGDSEIHICDVRVGVNGMVNNKDKPFRGCDPQRSIVHTTICSHKRMKI